ncbi:MAG TPA: response regulator [Allosphingosinicella sp.]|jgi:CheY-like chemotaxis protein|uniref:response regulator n=1 Tax=Allosphingosinicella sp. TaxID=2823234 RepID=UPI002F2A8B1B
MTDRPLRVLIVEDEMLVAMNIEDMLLDLGHEVAGLAGRLAPALSLASEAELDLAMLDVNLAGEQSFPVADILIGRGIPFLFATGYGIKGIPEAYRDRPVLQKPFRAQDLGEALARIAVSPSP